MPGQALTHKLQSGRADAWAIHSNLHLHQLDHLHEVVHGVPAQQRQEPAAQFEGFFVFPLMPYARDHVRLHPDLAHILLEWRKRAHFRGDTDWMFDSPKAGKPDIQWAVCQSPPKSPS